MVYLMFVADIWPYIRIYLYYILFTNKTNLFLKKTYTGEKSHEKNLKQDWFVCYGRTFKVASGETHKAQIAQNKYTTTSIHIWTMYKK